VRDTSGTNRLQARQVIRNIGTGGIGIPHELHPKRNPRIVRALVKAVRHHGERLRLITVRERGGMLGYDLVDGLHELMAAKILKRPIRAIVLPEILSSAVRDRPREKDRRCS
jgi:hypothetical protein